MGIRTGDGIIIALFVLASGMCFSPSWTSKPARSEVRAERAACNGFCAEHTDWGRFVCNEYCSGRITKTVGEK